MELNTNEMQHKEMNKSGIDYLYASLERSRLLLKYISAKRN